MGLEAFKMIKSKFKRTLKKVCYLGLNEVYPVNLISFKNETLLFDILLADQSMTPNLSSFEC